MSHIKRKEGGGDMFVRYQLIIIRDGIIGSAGAGPQNETMQKIVPGFLHERKRIVCGECERKADEFDRRACIFSTLIFVLLPISFPNEMF